MRTLNYESKVFYFSRSRLLAIVILLCVILAAYAVRVRSALSHPQQWKIAVSKEQQEKLQRSASYERDVNAILKAPTNGDVDVRKKLEDTVGNAMQQGVLPLVGPWPSIGEEELLRIYQKDPVQSKEAEAFVQYMRKSYPQYRPFPTRRNSEGR